MIKKSWIPSLMLVMFGEMVRAHRRQRGMSQEELAEAAGLSVRNIRKIEAGEVKTPRPSTIGLLAGVFGLTGADRVDFLDDLNHPDANRVRARLAVTTNGGRAASSPER